MKFLFLFVVLCVEIPPGWFRVRVGGGDLACVCEAGSCEALAAGACPGGRVWDPCGCCRVCARLEGEPCGGPHRFHGDCAEGLTCVVRARRELLDGGTCLRRHSGGVETCDSAVEVSGCDIVGHHCECWTMQRCLGDQGFSFGSKQECLDNLRVMLEEDGLDYQGDAVLDAELCPWDSSRGKDGQCVCDHRRCHKPECADGVHLQQVSKATGRPGDCCDVYDCVLQDDSSRANCSAVTCPPPPPPCPEDSYRLPSRGGPDSCCSTPLGCMCKPCPEYKCDDPKLRPKAVRFGSGVPGTCCPEYRCEKADVETPEKQASVTNSEAESETDLGSPVNLAPSGCMRNRTFYSVGDSWQEDDGCVSCTCERGGRPKCQSFMCQVTCDNPRRVQGECCPTCDGESVVTETAICPSLRSCSLRCVHGFLQDDQGCYTCQCQQEACLLECPDGFAQDGHGNKMCECAKRLSGDGSQCPPFECTKNCPNGYKYDSLGCPICNCEQCQSLKDCSKVCLHGFSTDSHNCPICRCLPSDANGPKSEVTPLSMNCSAGDVIRCDGEAWNDGCRMCYCSGGRVLCRLLTCPALTCPFPSYRSPSDCCPSCPGSLPDESSKGVILRSDCDRAGDQRSHTVNSPCLFCECQYGNLVCENLQCPPTPCERPIPPSSGECCPKCPPESMVQLNSPGRSCGQDRIHGKHWREGDCKSCTCDDGRVVCYQEQCLPLDCKLQVFVKGLCCPVCLHELNEELVSNNFGGSIAVFITFIVTISILAGLGFLFSLFLWIRRNRSHSVDLNRTEIKTTSSSMYSTPTKYSYNMIPTCPPEKIVPP